MRYFIFFISVFLSSCTSQKVSEPIDTATILNQLPSRYVIAQDGPPAKPILFFFQHLKPKDEPFSRYGNPEIYTVDGIRYRVLATANGYKARGRASWYGNKFHSQRTSSGEPYNMYAMTAAHKTLPLPCYVRVKNLSNGRAAIVRVNDRGPFHSTRLIDLSYAAATKLGILPQGTALVEVEALKPAGQHQLRTAHYYIQAGAFSVRKTAEKNISQIKKITGMSSFVEYYQGRYIVKIGPFVHQNKMDAIKKQLTSHGITGAFSILQ